MAMLNNVTIIGNLTRDVEQRALASGNHLTTFSIAVNDGYFDKQNQWVEKSHFFDCQLWGEAGQRLLEKSHKGDPVLVEGKLVQERWQNEAGQNRSKISITARRVQILHRAPRQDGPPPTTRSTPQPDRWAEPTTSSPRRPEPAYIPDEEIPF